MAETIIKQSIYTIVSRYLELYPDEKQRLDRVQTVLDGDSYIHLRSNMEGHITASSIIVDADKVLMIHHKTLNKWLCPGGHFDIEDEYLWVTAKREAEEETGIAGEKLRLHQWHIDNDMSPLDIDSHAIPANPKKNQGMHYHFDFKYVFSVVNKEKLYLALNEVIDFKWMKIEEINETYSLDYLKSKIKKFLNK
ncbi:MAG: NUDIX domain-containing protein [Brasilonema angustatum HA4187-MV1]|jgi:8-oxo-dGTP pyrophosphatase MutT (NUDIX family)|nr:NUDIX domain-containing protein [Brasilonema angustatum HA4187-MV1]